MIARNAKRVGHTEGSDGGNNHSMKNTKYLRGTVTKATNHVTSCLLVLVAAVVVLVK